RDLVGRDFIRVDAQAVVAAPQDGALAGRTIDDDIRRLVGAAFSELDVIEIDAGALEALDLDPAAFIIADGADVFDAQTEAGAGHHRARNLSAGAEDLFNERHFPRVGWKVRNYEQGIGGVEAHANNVELWHPPIL